MLSHPQFDELVASGCRLCKGQFLRAWALVPGTLTQSCGEPVTTVRFGYERDDIHDLVYKVECRDCAAVIYERSDCPLCGAAAGLGRVLERKNGLTPPARCPLCDYEELRVTAQLLVYHEYLHGHFSRRVCAAEPHEPGFHVAQVDCLNCEETVAAVATLKSAHTGAACVACGRSALLKKMR